MNIPTFTEESNLWNQGLSRVVGIDEVGRGAFAGPLVAAGVIFPKQSTSDSVLKDIRDSKMLSAKKRAYLSDIIKKYALSWEIIEVDIDFINTFGIGKATQYAFDQLALRMKADYLLTDAFPAPSFPKHLQKPLIHGDSLSLTIASASIIAKVYRDTLMEEYHHHYPQYNFKENKGYGTKFHREQLQKSGMCPIHRTSFNLSSFLPVSPA